VFNVTVFHIGHDYALVASFPIWGAGITLYIHNLAKSHGTLTRVFRGFMCYMWQGTIGNTGN